MALPAEDECLTRRAPAVQSGAPKGRRLFRNGVERYLNAVTGPLPASPTRVLHQPAKGQHQLLATGPR